MFVETQDEEQIIERVAALDIGKAEVVCCVRLQRPRKTRCRRCRRTRRCAVAVGAGEPAGRAGSDAGGDGGDQDYWRPPFYLFEAHGLEPWLVNAKESSICPGVRRPTFDAVWLCKVAERQMLRPSFVPPADIRRLRDLTRYRVDLVGVRTAEKNRVEKLLEDACIKLSVVARTFSGSPGGR